MGTQKTLRGQKYADRLGPVIRVGKDLFQSDFSTIAQGLTELSSKGGGTLVIGIGTFTITATLTLPAVPVKIVGQGRGVTILDIGTAAIDLFTISSDQEYSFEDFTARGGDVASQRCFRRTVAATNEKKTVVERVFLGDAGGTAFEQIFSNSSSGRYIVHDSSMFTRAVAAARVFDGSGLLEMSNCRHAGEGGITGSPAVRFQDLESFQIGATMALGSDSFIVDCSMVGSVGGGGVDTVATASNISVMGSKIESVIWTLTGGRSHFTGNPLLSVAASVRVMDVTGGTFHCTGNTFGGGSSEQIRISTTDSLIAENINCEVTETGGANRNRYWDIAPGSTIIGASSVVNGAKAGKYTGDGTTSQAITLGFQPRYVRIWREELVDGANTVVFETTTDIVADNAAGGAVFIDNNQVDFVTNVIISLTATGFTVDDDGIDADPNTSGQVYNFWAVE